MVKQYIMITHTLLHLTISIPLLLSIRFCAESYGTYIVPMSLDPSVLQYAGFR